MNQVEVEQKIYQMPPRDWRTSDTHSGDGPAKRRKTFDGSRRRLFERSALDGRAWIERASSAENGQIAPHEWPYRTLTP